MTFASLLQWFRILYDGALSKKVFNAGDDTGLVTGAPRITNYKSTWDVESSDLEDLTEVMVVPYGLRELASKHAVANNDLQPRHRTEQDLGRVVYEWLISENDLSRIKAKLHVCKLISP